MGSVLALIERILEHPTVVLIDDKSPHECSATYRDAAWFAAFRRANPAAR